MSSQTFWLALLVIALVVGLFLFMGWILMLLVNVVLAQYGVPALAYGSALAIEAILILFLGGQKASN